MNGAALVVRNMEQFRTELKGYEAERRKAGETAAKVELFRLKKQLESDLRAGGVAGRQFTPLRVVSRGTMSGKRPLSALAVAVRYQVENVGDKTVMSVGFEGPQSSKSWRRIAHAVQDGKQVSADLPVFGSTLRKLWATIGGDYKRGRGKSIAKYFFLRKDTSSLALPPRPIIEPFWQANESQATTNIISNFNRKMAGERI